MKQPILSILIPTVIGREDSLLKLLKSFCSNGIDKAIENFIFGNLIWMSEELEITIFKDNKEISIGEKRNMLYSSANGLFSIQVDDDDELAPNAIQLITEAIKSNPDVDCITFLEYVNINGIEYKSKHSLDYFGWEGDGSKLLEDGFHFHRTPFMKDVIKTEIAKSVLVPPIRFGEDHEWSKALKPYLKTEFHIPEQIYRYIHNSSDPTERYGLDK